MDRNGPDHLVIFENTSIELTCDCVNLSVYCRQSVETQWDMGFHRTLEQFGLVHMHHKLTQY